MTHIQIRPTWLIIGSLALLAAPGCADTSGPGAPENRGVLLATVDAGPSRLAWSSDGTQLVFATSNALSAISVSTHTVRQLDASPSIAILDLCSAGERIYFAAAVTMPGPTDPNFRVSRVNPAAGAAEIVLTKPWSGGEYVLVSEDERLLVANQVLYDVQAATQIALPAGRPIGFSPDGTQLLYYQRLAGSSTDSPTLISTADGSSQALHSTSTFYSGHRWEGNSPQLIDFGLDNGTLRLFEIDGVTGATRELAQFGANPSFPTILPLANWSADNRTLGVWVQQGSGQTRTTNLYVIRSGSAPAVVANVTTSLYVGVGQPIFSRSGNSVAYNYYNDRARSLYMKSGI
jgi:hypothetical protein